MKLFLIVRKDLAHGARAAQLCHAMRAFVAEHPEVDQEWFTKSNTLVLLEVEDEAALLARVDAVRSVGVPVSVFREPDLNDAATAAAIAPSGKKYVRDLPLAWSHSSVGRAAGF